MIMYILQLVTYFSFDLFQVFPFEGIIYAQGKKKNQIVQNIVHRQVKVLLKTKSELKKVRNQARFTAPPNLSPLTTHIHIRMLDFFTDAV